MPYTQVRILSYTGHVYAEAGVFVTLVADHGNVQIVTSGGQPFPVKSDCLGEESPEVVVEDFVEEVKPQLKLF